MTLSSLKNVIIVIIEKADDIVIIQKSSLDHDVSLQAPYDRCWLKHIVLVVWGASGKNDLKNTQVNSIYFRDQNCRYKFKVNLI